MRKTLDRPIRTNTDHHISPLFAYHASSSFVITLFPFCSALLVRFLSSSLFSVNVWTDENVNTYIGYHFRTVSLVPISYMRVSILSFLALLTLSF